MEQVGGLDKYGESFLLSFSRKVLREVIKYGPSLVSTSSSGFLKGFLLYFGPVTLLKRKLQGQTARRAVALGCFVSVVRFVDTLLKELRAKKIHTRFPLSLQNIIEKGIEEYPRAIAGGCGAFAAGLFDPSLINSIFVLWCLIRGLKYQVPTVKYGPVILMCVAASQIGLCWIRWPHLLDASYKRFLDNQSGKAASAVCYAAGKPVFARDVCHINHGDLPCGKHALSYFYTSFLRGVKLYAPIYGVFFLFAKKKSIPNLVENLLRSSAFIMGYCALPWTMFCIFYKWPFTSPDAPVSSLGLFMRLWVSGLSLAIERPSRQSELAGYVCTYVIDSVYRACITNNILKPNKAIGLMLLCLGASLLIHNHKDQPSIFSKWLLEFL